MPKRSKQNLHMIAAAIVREKDEHEDAFIHKSPSATHGLHPEPQIRQVSMDQESNSPDPALMARELKDSLSQLQAEKAALLSNSMRLHLANATLHSQLGVAAKTIKSLNEEIVGLNQELKGYKRIFTWHYTKSWFDCQRTTGYFMRLTFLTIFKFLL